MITMKRCIALTFMMMAAGLTQAQEVDTVKVKMFKLKEISISAPKPVYSMTGEVVNYNVENDETVHDLTAWDAIRNAPTVQIDEEGNITMRGSEKVEVWLNGRPTGMNGEMLKAFFESMPAEALARIEVIKNPSAKYMVEEGRHILNIVTSAKLRTSELWILGLSGNTRPYLSPWFSYVRNTDRLKFNIHVAGSHSHFLDSSNGDATLTDGGDTTSRYTYSSTSERPRYFGNLTFDIDYLVDSVTNLNISNFSMLQGDYDNIEVTRREQWDFRPDTVHYRYTDSSSSKNRNINGIANFYIKRRLPGRKGHNLTFGGSWNYSFSENSNLQQRLVGLAEGVDGSAPLQPYDRTKDIGNRNNMVDFSIRYNCPVGDNDVLSFRIGGRPYGKKHVDRTILNFNPLDGEYSLPDTLRNYVDAYRSNRLYGTLSWRHEWKQVTLTADLHSSCNWIHIDNRGNFPDDTTFRFFNIQPSLGLTYRTPSMHYFRFNVSHTTSHPTGSDLTVSRTYGDDNYSVGNRNLHNSYTEKASLSWNRYFQKIGNMGIEAYANYTSGGIESVTASTPYADPYIGRVITYSMPMNVASSYKAGADANVTYRPAAWASVSLNASLFRQGYAVEGEPMQEKTSWNMYARLWTKVAKLINIDANVSYGNPTLSLYRQEERTVSIGLGASATLLDGRLSLRVSVNDLLDNNRYNETIAAPTYSSNTQTHSSYRYLTFGLTWRIGKLDLEWQSRGAAAAGA